MLSMVIACTLLYLDAAGTRDLSGVYKQRSQSTSSSFPICCGIDVLGDCTVVCRVGHWGCTLRFPWILCACFTEMDRNGSTTSQTYVTPIRHKPQSSIGQANHRRFIAEPYFHSPCTRSSSTKKKKIPPLENWRMSPEKGPFLKGNE